MAKNIQLPEEEKRIFEKTVLPCLLAGESLTLMWVPHAGRTKAMNHLVENAEKFNFQKLGKYQIFYLRRNNLTEESPNAYFKLMLRSLNPSVKNQIEEPFLALKETLIEALKKIDHLIFIIGELENLPFNTLFYNNLYHLWQINKTAIHFLFTLDKDIFQKEDFPKYDQLRELLSQNLIFFPLFEGENQKFVGKAIAQKYNYQLPPSLHALAVELSGGHPALMKANFRILTKNPRLKDKKEVLNLLKEQLEIKIILEDIWNSFDHKEKETVLALSSGLNPKQLPERLIKLKLLKTPRGKPAELFSPLFELFVKENKKSATSNLMIDRQTGEILVNSQPVKEKITFQEYHLLSALLDSPNIVISRDKIAEILWGEESYDKYSDWSIDQTISQLRKKLEAVGVSPKILQTIKKRGYRLINN